MKKFFKKWWKFSSLRFYMLNAKWNLKFFLFSQKLYKTVNYQTPTDEMYTDLTNKIKIKTKNNTKKRFQGYMFENKIYLDNPGIPNIDRETWSVWKKKGLIK